MCLQKHDEQRYNGCQWWKSWDIAWDKLVQDFGNGGILGDEEVMGGARM